MTTLRHRKGIQASGVPDKDMKAEKEMGPTQNESDGVAVRKVLSTLLGTLAAVCLGLLTSVYVATLHENDLWFSNIKEIEREISFRTECGLYYSYYKQMVQAPSIRQGFYELMYDNKTESRRTINILKRMNIYQEVLLSVLYRLLPIQNYLEPVYFYIYSVFGLQTVYVIALYLTSWILSGTWLSGVLAAVWYILNRIDTTRVEFTIPLRENWSLPFFALQIAAVTYFLRTPINSLQQRLTLALVLMSTLFFSLTWQFNQFILLIQALTLFMLDCLDMVPTAKVSWLYIVQVVCLLLVWILQFFNSMILGSLVLSFILAALIVKHLQKNVKTGGFLVRIGKLLAHVALVLCLTLLVNNFVKKILQLESDEHIFKFIKAKFGFGATRDFDAKLYLCEEAFGVLPFDTFERLSDTLLFCAHIFILLALIIIAAVSVLQILSGYAIPQNSDGKEEESAFMLRPEVAYNFLHNFLFGILAISTMRMKYLWTSHVCVLASFGICSTELWRLVLKMIRLYTPQKVQVLRFAVPVLLLLYLSYKFWPRLIEELSDLREFYDPDTVELMNWIKSKTPKDAVFAGSMQLLAGVKLCTGRTITNHPHYEDKNLRERTKQVYQIYAKQPPEKVYGTLRSFGTNYVILEDSICYERRHSRGCRLRDLLDTENGHIMDGPGENAPGLKPSSYNRFCDEIKANVSSFSIYFTRVFQNKTFHVYKLKKHRNKMTQN
ncbi:protein C-mannosyl-transferase DPY19L3 [Latimeria chalumnae]|uniref:Dpy-19 like C-mannosyltransferase 3 n=1 Tax=Latimeria chalumnae TaxID=7897 RepID=M3XHI5_LATCH|nr:PREDICTED: probable C-mannosyltransferase DPY19L3 isoform X1 [Latimeria chalumnae]XP_014345339.1 PREDICTED: probable C-mannosyltransferase DPY19L3 isoform X1 [Latimeria chalumnae]XP_014345340.1 PREDICTED: probable C-mannosyltransferase DPY19L3 isoform X1 [Latimeria chalumnae]XP_014345341.1 PREDICTED: probable C-mannosyltransferase DPY19L3 isoform X1 [Latimeria chalumnae]XP_014345342.1 PREDICTED: probable C-mannosyltransferase DPY19L3 isoform X1 [Latimeria chalumnae]|eukprot:XP_005998407.1 PREDICTED: probable C-mannosyltransferase DPY19L3 isoform X1 [Latimeria chalumnae]